jgi:SAM-dependent methyltransferase
MNWIKVLALFGFSMSLQASDSIESHNLSHEKIDVSMQATLQRLQEKIQKRQDLPYASVARQLDLLDQLTQFDLGKFLIETGGLNGYWTHYVITHPDHGRLSKKNLRGEPFSSLETFILDKAPVVLATQQRFAIFKEVLQNKVQEGCSLASVPCGLMADLLSLDYAGLQNFTLTGVDIDPDSIQHAQNFAKEKELQDKCRFAQQDAWNLCFSEEFDVITSNGLSIYEQDDEKVVELYRSFFLSLKRGGWIVTSFLTPPPALGMHSEWDLTQIDLQDALLQKILFADILESKWQVFRSEKTVRKQLEKAGFHI